MMKFLPTFGGQARRTAQESVLSFTETLPWARAQLSRKCKSEGDKSTRQK